MSQSLTKADPIVDTGLIRSADAFASKLEALRTKFHVLTPVVNVSHLAEGYGATVAIVAIDPTVDGLGRGTDTYFSSGFMQKGRDAKSAERALSKLGLLKIARAAGINWPSDHCRRVDDGTVPYLWRWQHLGFYRDTDGTWATLPGSKDLDLRDGSAQIGGWTPAKWAELTARNEALLKKHARELDACKSYEDRQKLQKQIGVEFAINGWSEKRILQARAAGNQIAETKSMLNAIRKYGIAGVYTVGDLAKPFAVVRFQFVPDMSDPEIKRIVTIAHLQGVSALYARSSRPEIAAPAAPAPVHSADVVDVTPAAPGAAAATVEVEDVSTAPGAELEAEIEDASTAPPAEAEADEDRPTAYAIVKILRHRQGSTVRYSIDLETGGEDAGQVWTDDEGLVNAAAKAKREKALVYVITEKDGETEVLLELQPADASAPANRPAGSRLVADVRPVSRDKWTRYDVTFDDGTIASTFDQRIGQDAELAARERFPVVATIHASEKYPDRNDLAALKVLDPRQPSLYDN